MQPRSKVRSTVENPPNPGAEILGRTLERLRQAREACRTANLERLLGALDILQTASAEFEAWTEQFRHGSRMAAGPLGSELTRFKREVASFLRLVDTCASVQRGLSARSGATAVAYSPNGGAPIPASISSAYDMQG
ncbi:MAG: hypothetical protein ACLQVN_01675 [Bryobacteraceae bacterium]